MENESVLAESDEFRWVMDLDSGMCHLLDGEDTIRVSMDYDTLWNMFQSFGDKQVMRSIR